MKEMLSMRLDRHFYSSVCSLKSVNQYIKVQTSILMVNVNTSTLVTSIYSLLLKEFSRFIKLEGNALNATRSTLSLICSHMEKCISIQESPKLYM